jgi:lambda repressor-like predicted transcriptional regulator
MRGSRDRYKGVQPSCIGNWTPVREQASPSRPSAFLRGIGSSSRVWGVSVIRNGCDHYWHVYGMGVIVHPGQLRLELARRGWSAADLARQAGVSPPTLSAALAGRAISARSLRLVAEALGRVPPLPIVDSLVDPGQGRPTGSDRGLG